MKIIIAWRYEISFDSPYETDREMDWQAKVQVMWYYNGLKP